MVLNQQSLFLIKCFPDQCCYTLLIPFGKSPSLHNQFIILWEIEVIVKRKPSSGLLPSNFLAKPQIIEHKGVFPLFSSIVTLGESLQAINISLFRKCRKEIFITGKIF